MNCFKPCSQPHPHANGDSRDPRDPCDPFGVHDAPGDKKMPSTRAASSCRDPEILVGSSIAFHLKISFEKLPEELSMKYIPMKYIPMKYIPMKYIPCLTDIHILNDYPPLPPTQHIIVTSTKSRFATRLVTL